MRPFHPIHRSQPFDAEMFENDRVTVKFFVGEYLSQEASSQKRMELVHITVDIIFEKMIASSAKVTANDG